MGYIMNYIVMDLEWNQSPDGKIGSYDDVPFEIIQIGAVKLDDKLQKEAFLSVYRR